MWISKYCYVEESLNILFCEKSRFVFQLYLVLKQLKERLKLRYTYCVNLEALTALPIYLVYYYFTSVKILLHIQIIHNVFVFVYYLLFVYLFCYL